MVRAYLTPPRPAVPIPAHTRPRFSGPVLPRATVPFWHAGRRDTARSDESPSQARRRFESRRTPRFRISPLRASGKPIARLARASARLSSLVSGAVNRRVESLSPPPRHLPLPTSQATEQKKEAFRKYLESAGVIDSLTKGVPPSHPASLFPPFAHPVPASADPPISPRVPLVSPLPPAVLVSLYEEPDKPATAIDYLKANLGGPTPAEFEALTEERNALAAELETCKKELAEAQAKLEGQAVAEGAEEPAE